MRRHGSGKGSRSRALGRLLWEKSFRSAGSLLRVDPHGATHRVA